VHVDWHFVDAKRHIDDLHNPILGHAARQLILSFSSSGRLFFTPAEDQVGDDPKPRNGLDRVLGRLGFDLLQLFRWGCRSGGCLNNLGTLVSELPDRLKNGSDSISPTVPPISTRTTSVSG